MSPPLGRWRCERCGAVLGRQRGSGGRRRYCEPCGPVAAVEARTSRRYRSCAECGKRYRTMTSRLLCSECAVPVVADELQARREAKRGKR